MRESSTYQAILEEGRLEQSQRLLLLLGRSYCGKASAAIQAVIAGLSDLERLERMIQQAPKATSWTDLLATP